MFIHWQLVGFIEKLVLALCMYICAGEKHIDMQLKKLATIECLMWCESCMSMDIEDFNSKV